MHQFQADISEGDHKTSSTGNIPQPIKIKIPVIMGAQMQRSRSGRRSLRQVKGVYIKGIDNITK